MAGKEPRSRSRSKAANRGAWRLRPNEPTKQPLEADQAGNVPRPNEEDAEEEGAEEGDRGTRQARGGRVARRGGTRVISNMSAHPPSPG